MYRPDHRLPESISKSRLVKLVAGEEPIPDSDPVFINQKKMLYECILPVYFMYLNRIEKKF